MDRYFNERRSALPVKLVHGRTQPIWIDVYVPEAASPGLYQGQIRVSSGGAGRVSIPLELEVWNFKLPSTSTLPTTFGFSGNTAVRAHYGAPARQEPTPPSPIDDDGPAGANGHHLQPSSAEQSNGNGNVNRQATIRQTSAEQYQEAKRKMLMKDLEGLIPVVTPEDAEGGAAGPAGARREDAEEMPHMSATSYPGQEWNPYGEFGYDDDE